MIYRRLGPDDATHYRALRIAGLRESPTAFVSTPEEEEALPAEVTAQRLQHTPANATFGAYDATGRLVGICTVKRERQARLAHKAWLVGVYVDPTARGQGVGRRVIKSATDFAASIGVRQINLGVNVANLPARRLYEQLGFQVFGTERDFMRVDGVFQDELQMVCFLDAAR